MRINSLNTHIIKFPLVLTNLQCSPDHETFAIYLKLAYVKHVLTSSNALNTWPFSRDENFIMTLLPQCRIVGATKVVKALIS